MVNYTYISCRTALSTSRLPGLDYCLNPYIGCEHGCRYCYSPSILRRFNEPWGSYVQIKANVAEVLLSNLAAKRPGTVGVSTITDPYQPVEERLELTRRCVEILAATRFHTSIQTKSDLVARDFEILHPDRCDLGVTITTLDDDLAARLEPHAPKPSARALALTEASSQGIPTWIFLGPLIPFVNDDETNLKSIFLLAQKTRSHIIHDKLNLKHDTLQNLTPVLNTLGLEPQKLKEQLDPHSDFCKNLTSTIEKLGSAYEVRAEPAFDKPLKARQLTLL